ncbi:hypothetical protein DL771_007706 [Monosporascus sp. 5C6A]|nr:hypothetical protein DL771_007706 [Monosporascus sp. 5C6A]
MGGGNGAKAAQKRERANKKNAKAGPSSQLKTNAKFNNEKLCGFCRRGFNHTVADDILRQHALDHKDKGKTVKECFPWLDE